MNLPLNSSVKEKDMSVKTKRERHPQRLPNWQPSMVRSQMRPLRLSEKMELTPLEMSYCHHYGLDFENTLDFIRHQFGYIDTDGYRIAVHTFEAEYQYKGTVLLLHGLYDHSGLYDAIIEHFLKKGFNVVIFDLPGHGLSSGSPAAIKDFREYVKVFERILSLCLDTFGSSNTPLHVIAQSTGCSVVMDYLLDKGITTEQSPFKSIVFLAPLIRPRAWGASKLAYVFLSPFIRKLKRKYLVNSSDEKFVRFIREYDPLQAQELSVSWVGALRKWIKRIEKMPPTVLEPVVIQGHLDKTVDWQHNVTKLTRLFHHPVVHFFPKASHHIANERTDILEEILDRIDALYHA